MGKDESKIPGIKYTLVLESCRLHHFSSKNINEKKKHFQIFLSNVKRSV